MRLITPRGSAQGDSARAAVIVSMRHYYMPEIIP